MDDSKSESDYWLRFPLHPSVQTASGAHQAPFQRISWPISLKIKWSRCEARESYPCGARAKKRRSYSSNSRCILALWCLIRRARTIVLLSEYFNCSTDTVNPRLSHLIGQGWLFAVLYLAYNLVDTKLGSQITYPTQCFGKKKDA